MFLDMNVDYLGQKWLNCLSVDSFPVVYDHGHYLFSCCILPPNIQKPCALVISVIITVFIPERSRAISDDTERKTFRVFEGDQRAKH